jgi:RNA polymerase sigma factor (sigma-70 family)
MFSLAVLELGSTMLAAVGEADGSNDLEWERQTVALAQRGDRAALGRLLVAFGPRLYRSVLLPRLGSEAAAKDGLAETYAKVVERIDQFRWQGMGFYPWVRTIAFRVAIDVLRGRARVLFWDEDALAKELDRESGDTPTDQRLTALRDERAAREKVKAALDRIHPRYARAIQLRLLDEQPREDAARILGVTLATFDVLLHRSIQALKKDLAAHEREQR